MTVLTRFRENTLVRALAQTCLIVVLLGLGYLAAAYDDEAETNEQTTQAVSSVVAAACDAATFEDLRAQGLLEECRLAQAGELGDVLSDEVEESAPPAADPIPDDPDTTPGEVQQVSNRRLAAAAEVAVNAYFEENPIPGDEEYQTAIKRTVAAYLRANPPRPGRPPNPGEIRRAVRDALLANPPDAGPPGEPGTPGAAGVGVAKASLEGCNVVFTYSDGDTDTVGPLCGEDGEPGPPPSAADIAAQVKAYCDANGECRGPTGLVSVVDNCPPAPQGEFLTGIETAYDADTSTLTITCTTAGVLAP